MSRLIGRILLSILLLPLAAIFYLTVYIYCWKSQLSLSGDRYLWSPVLAGLMTWALVIIYWVLLWRKSVRWTVGRVTGTFLAAVGGIAVGLVAGILTHQFERDTAAFIGSVVPPLLWLIATVLLWQETAAERVERLRGAGRGTVVCPACGYNLIGLSEARCPECGARYTLDELAAAQPGREGEELEKT